MYTRITNQVHFKQVAEVGGVVYVDVVNSDDSDVLEYCVPLPIAKERYHGKLQ